MKKRGQFAKVAVVVLPLLLLTACSTTKSDQLDNTSATSSAVNDMGDALQSQHATTSEQIQQLQLQQEDTVYFAYDKYNITAEYASSLTKQANFLRNNPTVKVVIQGYTDERGTPEYNIALGERRANAVKMYLLGQGVNPNQITTVSYGKEKPAVLGHNEAAYAKNRRAVIVYPSALTE